MAGQFETPTPQYREKLWSDECRDADPDMNAPVVVYPFPTRQFKEQKPYEPSKWYLTQMMTYNARKVSTMRYQNQLKPLTRLKNGFGLVRNKKTI